MVPGAWDTCCAPIFILLLLILLYVLPKNAQWCTSISFAFRGMIFVRMLKSLCGMISMRLLEQSVAGSTVESTFSAPNAPQNGPPVVWCQVIFSPFFSKQPVPARKPWNSLLKTLLPSLPQVKYHWFNNQILWFQRHPLRTVYSHLERSVCTNEFWALGMGNVFGALGKHPRALWGRRFN